ncbi:MAG TPA: carbonate dehydratase [bacterium]|nr:carbonate dehydratase [bacterium]
MNALKHLFRNNRSWAERREEKEPGYFRRLARIQRPDYLWIGCSDSRVPANEIVGLDPGELFVHRNVANVVVHTDLNCLSVIEFAVRQLKVRHIIVCGHYGCGGVQAAMESRSHGVIDNWLRHVKDVYSDNARELDRLRNKRERSNRLCRLNVRAQMINVCATSTVQDAWKRGQKLSVHGWIYDIHDGLLDDLCRPIESKLQIDRIFRRR